MREKSRTKKKRYSYEACQKRTLRLSAILQTHNETVEKPLNCKIFLQTALFLLILSIVNTRRFHGAIQTLFLRPDEADSGFLTDLPQMTAKSASI